MPTPVKKNKSFGVLKSDANRPKDKPFIGPKPLDKIKVKKIKDKINRLEESFNEASRLSSKGYGGWTQNMYNISKDATKLNKELIKLTGKGSPQFEFIRKRKK